MKTENAQRMEVTFYRQWQAFPHTRKTSPDEILVGVAPDGPDAGGYYEFRIEHVGTEPGQRRPIALRVGLFVDSWRAFRDLPEFFDLLADLDESKNAGRSMFTLDDLVPSLEAIGWRDRTEDLAARHQHALGMAFPSGGRGDAASGPPAPEQGLGGTRTPRSDS